MSNNLITLTEFLSDNNDKISVKIYEYPPRDVVIFENQKDPEFQAIANRFCFDTIKGAIGSYNRWAWNKKEPNDKPLFVFAIATKNHICIFSPKDKK